MQLTTITLHVTEESTDRLPAVQTVPALAIYALSEAGRRAAQLAGLGGRARQVHRIDVPPARLHLIATNVRGCACLKLRPRYERATDQRIVRTDKMPIFDAPPTVEELFALAARNHEFERAYDAERAAVSAERVAVRAREEELSSDQPSLIPPSSIAIRSSSTNAQGRLAFVDLVIDEHTFHLFEGLKVCSFVILEPSESGGPLRVWVPSHKLPGGQRLLHLQEATDTGGDLGALGRAILEAYAWHVGAESTTRPAPADTTGEGTPVCTP